MSTPFHTTRSYLNATPGRTTGAAVASVLAALTFAALLPVAYLFVDHLVWKGHVPEYHELTPSRQDAFRNEWDAIAENPGVKDVLARLRAAKFDGVVPESGRWSWRWQAATYQLLKDRVSPDAADAYLILPDPTQAPEGESNQVITPTGNRLGVLSHVAWQRGRWDGSLTARVARLSGWSWRPDNGTLPNARYLTGLFAVALALVLLYTGCVLVAEHMAASASLDAVGRIRRALFSHASRLGVLATKPQASAEVGTLFTDKTGKLEDGLRAWLTAAWRGPVLTGLLVLIVLIVNPWMGVAFLLTGALVWVVGGQMAAWYRRDGRAAARRAEARRVQMRESLGMLHLVKSYLMDRFNQARIERQVTDYTRAEWRRLRGQALSAPALTGAVLTAAVFMLYLGGRTVLGGEYSLAALTVQALGLAALIGPVRAWVATRLKIRKARDASSDIVEFLDRRVDAGQPIDAEFLHAMTRRLEFTDVSYREPGTGRMVLENVTLSIPTGTRVAVVGSDQDEVHAFAFLLTRFLDPTAGEVKIDGKNLRWVTLDSLRTQVALVMQTGLVFNDSVANNIGCGDAGFTLPQVIEAAKIAHAHGFVQRLPFGYETLVGDAGHALRPGEKLRIALARAILRDPALIVVEEPDAPLDHDTKSLLDDTFERLRTGRTLVILSRRSSVLRAADQVFVLHRGRLAASGTHDELMRSSELYRNILFQEIPVAGVPA